MNIYNEDNIDFNIFFFRIFLNFNLTKLSFKKIFSGLFGFKKRKKKNCIYMLNFFENFFNNFSTQTEKKFFHIFKKKKKKIKYLNYLFKIKKPNFEFCNFKYLQSWKIFDIRQESFWVFKKKKKNLIFFSDNHNQNKIKKKKSFLLQYLFFFFKI